MRYNKKTKQIVIAGGGFGGIKTALELAGDRRLSIKLITDKDHFVYYPALYGAATGYDHREASVKLRNIFSEHHNVEIVIDTLTHVDAARKLIRSETAEYQYDELVMALGVVTNYFNIPGLKENSYSIKSVAEVERFKTHLHDEATSLKHLDKRYIVIGGGATGVELAASLGTYLGRIAEIHHVPHKRIAIDLVEASPRILPRMSEKASRLVAKRLKRLGVTVMTSARVEAADPSSLTVNGKKLQSQSVVWTSGVSNNPFFAANDHVFSLSQNGRVIVDEHLRAAKHIYVIGDNAATQYSGLAQTALGDAMFLARNIKRQLSGRSMRHYKPTKPPVVIPAGNGWAVFEYGPITFGGPLASLIREAADIIGYHDVLPIGKALNTWSAQRIREDYCVVCDGQ